MKTTTDPLAEHQREWPKTELLPRTVRRLIVTLTLPAILSGCAHQANIPPKQASSGSGERVFRVAPSPSAMHRLNTYAANLPELSDSFSSTAIIEHILSRQKIIAATPAGKNGRRGVKEPLTTQSRRTLAGVKTAAKPGWKKSRHHGDHWETVRGGLVLADVEHEAVDAQLAQLRDHPKAVDFLMRRAEPYLQYLLEEIDRQGLPTDLILVPMVESAFEPTALSPKQAAGIWQFIPSTGVQYGLQVSDSYDARYDIHASTQAALKYLKHLHKMFNGDWMLAFAAYNAGEGSVSRAIEASRKNGQGRTFWDLNLPDETEAYVLKILALAHAIADPGTYGFKPRKAGSGSSLIRVEVNPEARVADILASSGLPAEAFYRLNPAVKADAQSPLRTPNLLLPLDKAEILVANLAGTKIHAIRKVVVKKGETLSILAKRHGVPELKLAEWNGLKPKAQLKPGQELLVYPV